MAEKLNAMIAVIGIDNIRFGSMPLKKSAMRGAELTYWSFFSGTSTPRALAAAPERDREEPL